VPPRTGNTLSVILAALASPRLPECEVAIIYRDVRACQIYKGASDIQRMLVARAL